MLDGSQRAEGKHTVRDSVDSQSNLCSAKQHVGKQNEGMKPVLLG